MVKHVSHFGFEQIKIAPELSGCCTDCLSGLNMIMDLIILLTAYLVYYLGFTLMYQPCCNGLVLCMYKKIVTYSTKHGLKLWFGPSFFELTLYHVFEFG